MASLSDLRELIETLLLDAASSQADSLAADIENRASTAAITDGRPLTPPRLS